jgi:hypothetical protein
LVVGMLLMLLVEWLWHFHDVQLTWWVLLEQLQQVTTTTCNKDAMHFVLRIGGWVHQSNV